MQSRQQRATLTINACTLYSEESRTHTEQRWVRRDWTLSLVSAVCIEADMLRHISFLVHSDAAIVQQETKVIWVQGALTSSCGHVNWLWKY